MKLFMGVLLVALAINVAGTLDGWANLIPLICMAVGSLLLSVYDSEVRGGK